MDIKHYYDLSEKLSHCNSIRGALFYLKNHYTEFQDCDLGYEYFVRKNAYIRGDIIAETTLPRHITDLYAPSGGQNADPIVENIADMKETMSIDLAKLCSDHKSKYYRNAFFEGLQTYDCQTITAYAFLPPGDFGFGALTLMQSKSYKATNLEPTHFADIGYALHTILKRQGHISRFIGITEKERFVIEKMADGKTAQDVAQYLNITPRTIEMRLQSARKKLKARTTTEAVYKSVCYGA